MIFTLACINAMETVVRDTDSRSLAATDFGPAGVAAGAIVLFLLPRPRPVERTLVLALWAVMAVLLGTALGYRVAPSPAGLATIPLVAVASALFHRRALAEQRRESLRRAPVRRRLTERGTADLAAPVRAPQRPARAAAAPEPAAALEPSELQNV